jgi:hypothetical protein
VGFQLDNNDVTGCCIVSAFWWVLSLGSFGVLSLTSLLNVLFLFFILVDLNPTFSYFLNSNLE